MRFGFANSCHHHGSFIVNYPYSIHIINIFHTWNNNPSVETESKAAVCPRSSLRLVPESLRTRPITYYVAAGILKLWSE